MSYIETHAVRVKKALDICLRKSSIMKGKDPKRLQALHNAATMSLNKTIHLDIEDALIIHKYLGE